MQNIEATLNQSGRYAETTSPRFNPITTGQVIENLEGLGWVPFSSKVVKTRNLERRPYAKHLVCLKQKAEQAGQVGEYLPRLNLRNANDGTASFEVFAGFYRLICSNGLAIGTTYATAKIRHSLSLDKLGDAVAHAVASTEEQLKKGDSVIKEWQRITLTTTQRENLAGFAVGLRWQNLFSDSMREKVGQTMENPNTFLVSEYRERVESVLRVRRSEDNSSSLWHTFNAIQENVIQGGFNIYSPRNFRGGVAVRPVLSRRLGNIAESVRINRALWDGAEKIANGETLPTLALTS
jgi:hypothetical protein